MCLNTFVYVATVLICAAFADGCETREFEEDVDWTKMSGHWYESMNIPATYQPVNCWDWTNFTTVEDGFTTIIQQKIAGKRYQPFDLHFIRKRRGIYVCDKKSMRSYRKSARIVLSHMDRKEAEAYIKETVRYFLSMEYFFLTDTKTYFASVMCTPDGWHSWIKHSTPIPGVPEMANTWNAFSRREINAHVEVNTLCWPAKE